MRRAGGKGSAKGAEPDGPQCNGCGSAFSLFNWKHHCRRCGKAFCDNCSKDRAVLSAPEFGKEPQRVCHPCKVAERRFRLEGQGKRGNRRESDDARSAPVVDLGLGADPLSGKELGEPITSEDLQDPLVSSMLEDLGFGGQPQTAGSLNKPGGKAGAPVARGKGKAAARPVTLPPSLVSEVPVTDAVAAEKKRALALRKAGKGDEALQALRHAHELEAQAGSDGPNSKVPGVKAKGGRGKSMFDVSDADMVDPDLLAELHELGWSEETATKPKRKPAAALVTAGGGPDLPAGGGAAMTAVGGAAVTAGSSKTGTADNGVELTAGGSAVLTAGRNGRVPAGGSAAVTAGSSPDKWAALEAQVTERKKAALQLRKSGQLERWHLEMAALRQLQAQLDQPEEALPAEGKSVSAAETADRGGGVAGGLREGAKNETPSKQETKSKAKTESSPDQKKDRTGGPAGGAASKEALEREVLSRKRAALACKKAGDLEGAKAAMKEVRLLENQLASAAQVPQRESAGEVPSRKAARAAPANSMGPAAEHDDPDVTSDDESDPEIAAALREMGWQDEDRRRAAPPAQRRQVSERAAGEQLDALVGAAVDVAARKTALAADAAARRRAALTKKRAGDIEGAKEELRQAKMIEARLEEAEATETAGLLRASNRGVAAGAPPLATIVADAMRMDGGEVAAPEVDSDDETDPEILAALREMGWWDETPGRGATVSKRGESGVAGPAVQQQGTASSWQPRKAHAAAIGGQQEQRRMGGAAVQLLDGGDDDVAVTSDDEQDPAILAALQEMGWQDERPAPRAATSAAASGALTRAAPRPRGREELLAQVGPLKRKALGLRKQGKMDEWRATMQEAQELEREAEQADARPAAAAAAAAPPRARATAGDADDAHVEVTEDDETDPAMLAALHAMGWEEETPVQLPVSSSGGAAGRGVSHAGTPGYTTGGYRIASEDTNVGRSVIPVSASPLPVTAVRPSLVASLPVPPTGGPATSGVRHEVIPGYTTGGYRVASMYSDAGYRVTPVSEGPLPVDLFSVDAEANPVTDLGYGQPTGRGDEWTAGRERTGVDSVGDRASGLQSGAGPSGVGFQETQQVGRISGDLAVPGSQRVPGFQSVLGSQALPGEFIPTGKIDGLERRAFQDSEGQMRTSEERRKSQSPGQSEPAAPRSGPPSYWPESSPEEGSGQKLGTSRRNSQSSAEPAGTGTVRPSYWPESSPVSPALGPFDSPSSVRAEEQSVSRPKTSPGEERRDVSTPARRDSSASLAGPRGQSSSGNGRENVSTPGGKNRASPAETAAATAADLEERVRTGKQTAVRLKREGRLQEARAALMQAREWERQLAAQRNHAPSDGHNITSRESDGDDDGSKPTDGDVDPSVEDAFDPAMVAALKGLGWTDEQIRGGMGTAPGRPRPAAVRPAASEAAPSGDRAAVEERVKREKRRALELKRAGMQQEALAVLRGVKQLEKQLVG